MNENTARETTWAPDECPEDVVELIDIEQQLAALGIRGLASSDSKALRTAWRKLSGLLRANYERGFYKGIALGLFLGVVAATTVALLVTQSA